MTPKEQSTSLSRTYTIGLAAFVLLFATTSLGIYLGTQTRSQFNEIEASWADYEGGVDRTGAWISSIRGHLGYGGIIHNFKNYILREDSQYYRRAEEQIGHFNSVVQLYVTHSRSAEEQAALMTIKKTIDEYAVKLSVARNSFAQNVSPIETDRLVAVDDKAAIEALAFLEGFWREKRVVSTERIFDAVGRGQWLIWIGFASIAALLIAAFILGCLLILLIRDLRRTVLQLSDELVVRSKLEQSEGRLARAVEQSPATIFITDIDERILYVNRRFTELTGWTSEEVEGKTPKFLQSGDTSSKVYKEIRRALKAGTEWHGVFRNRKKSGDSYWVETTILPLVGADGVIQNYIGIGEDVTEKRQARDQVARAQKLEAVGLLAGGIAHDFNNILTTIVGAAHLAELDAPEGSDIAGEIKQIDIAARRAQSLVKGLLTFARRKPGKPLPNDIGVVVLEVFRLLRASTPQNIELSFSNNSDEFVVLADQTQLHQIVMNLCRNAAEAFGHNTGTIEAKLSRHDNTPEKLPYRAAGWVQLQICDDGPGMTADTLKHLFDPFFTTKPMGKGSGLGMTVVSGLVEEMGADISVESQLGSGTIFTINLPATDEKEQIDEVNSTELPRGTECIILVDDEPEVAATFRRLLLRFGYRVEAFTSSVVALERIKADPTRYDLMITDMVMPTLTGEALANSARELRPDLPIIISTGYNPKGISVQGKKPTVLSKPVDPALLARTIRTLLNAQSN